MLPSPLRTMSPLAAATTEHRINGIWHRKSTINPDKDQRCTVRLQGDLTVRYRICTVGGPVLPAAQTVHREAPLRFDRSFEIYDDRTFFRSYTACGDAFHWMLEQTLGDEFDLGADNWDHFIPHEFAVANVADFRCETQKLRGVTLRYNIDMTLAICVDVLCDEPKALLLACMRWDAAVAQGGGNRECCVCMEGLLVEEEEQEQEEEDETVRLPCSHTFHRECIAPWFYKAATCPMCRQYEQLP